MLCLKAAPQGNEGQALTFSFPHHSSYQQRSQPWTQQAELFNSAEYAPRTGECTQGPNTAIFVYPTHKAGTLRLLSTRN